MLCYTQRPIVKFAREAAFIADLMQTPQISYFSTKRYELLCYCFHMNKYIITQVNVRKWTEKFCLQCNIFYLRVH